jgi:hypothetical protein
VIIDLLRRLPQLRGDLGARVRFRQPAQHIDGTPWGALIMKLVARHAVESAVKFMINAGGGGGR